MVTLSAARQGGQHQGTGSKATIKHRDDIQGLRAIAVLLVVLSHAGVGFLAGGYVGVDVFFVLSGFLITGLIFSGAAERGHVSFVEFYGRRARRILPAAALTLVVTDVVVYQVLNFVRAQECMHDSISAALFTSNFHFIHQATDYFAQGQPPSPVQHYWSLSVEEQFYFVWPALFAFVLGLSLRRRAHRSVEAVEQAVPWILAVVIIISVTSLAWSIHYTNANPAASYFATFTRVWELGLGAALALCGVQLVRLPTKWRAAMGWLGLAAIAAASILFSSSTPFPGYAALLPTVGAALVIAAGMADQQPRGGIGGMLSLAPMRYVGDRSYALYLWHWPILIIAVEYEGGLSVGVKLLLMVGAFLLSIVTYRYYENPLRRVSWRPPSRVLVLWPASVLVVVIVAGIHLSSIANKEAGQAIAAAQVSTAHGGQDGKATRGRAARQSKRAAATTAAEQPLPAVVQAYAAAKHGAAIPTVLDPPTGSLLSDYYSFPTGCSATAPEQTSSTICHLGVSGGRALTVIGDSHAEMWMPAILDMAQRDGWDVVPLSKSGCTLAERVTQASGSACRAWYDWAVGRLAALHPDVALIADDYHDYGLSQSTNAASVKGIAQLVAEARRTATQVVVVGDPPGQRQRPVDCLLTPGATMADCSTTISHAQAAVSEQVSSVARLEGAGFMPTANWFCYSVTCPMVIGHTVAYRDPGHITSTYAQELSKPFGVAFSRALRDAKSG